MEVKSAKNEYLSTIHFKGFDQYKYSCKDTSPISNYIMHPMWNFIVEYVPRCIAPNVLTFVGFLFTVLNFVLLSWYDWDFFASTASLDYKPVPQFIWLLASVNIFLAYTLDGIDGKQARRIGLSGPLGELFDHGLDSYSAVIIPICLYSIFGRLEMSVPPIRMFYIIWTILFSFYASHVEKYITGVLYLPWGYDIGMIGSTLMFAATGIWGESLWKHSLSIGGLTSGNLLELSLHLSALSNLPISFYNIYLSYKEKTGKMRSTLECMRPLLPLVSFLVISCIWVHWSKNDIISTHARAVFLLNGTIFSNISCRLIVSQMSNTLSENLNYLTPIFGVCFIISYLIPSLEVTITYLLLIGSTFAHWHYGCKVVMQLCVHFKRICFGVGTLKQHDN